MIKTLLIFLSMTATAGAMDLSLKDAPQGEAIKDSDVLLFSESNTRFVIEVPKDKKKAFETFMKGMPFGFSV